MKKIRETGKKEKERKKRKLLKRGIFCSIAISPHDNTTMIEDTYLLSKKSPYYYPTCCSTTSKGNNRGQRSRNGLSALPLPVAKHFEATENH